MTDEDKVIWVARAENRTSNKYHTNKNCRNLGDNPKKTTLGKFQKPDASECRYCSDEVEVDHTGSRNDGMLRAALETSPEEIGL